MKKAPYWADVLSSDQKKKSRKRQKRQKSRIPSPSRLMAVKVLSTWLSRKPGKRPEIEEMAGKALEGGGLSQKDRALFWNILIGTIRWLRLLRWHLDRYLKRFSKLPVEVQAILLTGAYQIVFLSRIPYFSAVNEAVEISRSLGCGWACRLVNASLRNLARGDKILLQDMDKLLERCSKGFENCVSNLTSHPHWMVKRWTMRFGRRQCLSICLSNNEPPDVVIRVNTLRLTRSRMKALLSEHGMEAEETVFSPYGLRLKGFQGRIEELPGFELGYFQVQDEASQLAAILLGPKSGDRVLDVCAGVGGKSTAIAQLMNDEGIVTACDTNRRRLLLLEENAKRLGLSSISAFGLPSRRKQVEEMGPYDKILIDAPCSGLGVIRRHPDIKWNRLPQDIEKLSSIQSRLLDEWSSLLRPGGLLVYCVCTMEAEETTFQVERFLKSRKDFCLMDAPSVLGDLPGKFAKGGSILICPGACNMDGFFMALFRKAG